MTQLVTAFQGLVPGRFKLNRQGSYWQVVEPGAPNSLFELAAGRSHAFSLDESGLDVFPFFTGGLTGMRSVNDALVVSTIGETTYMLAVELKSSERKVPEALNQIESGRLFSRWVRELLSVHGHWTGGACRFFGVVSLPGRRQRPKGTTTRKASLPPPGTSRHGGGYPCFVLRNHPRTSVEDLVKTLEARGFNCPAAV
jgi:hypothetical protein